MNEDNLHRGEPLTPVTLHDSLHAMPKGDLVESIKAMIDIGESDESANEECFGVFSEAESVEDEEEELPAPESDSDGPRGSEPEEVYEVDPVFPSSNEEEGHELSPSPEREVLFTPTKPASKNAKRNARRRIQKKILRDQLQHDENKTRTESEKKQRTERINPFQRLGPPTSSTEIMSDSDARAGRRPDNNNDKKRRRESQESVEEVDSQGRKLPTNKHKYQRN